MQEGDRQEYSVSAVYGLDDVTRTVTELLLPLWHEGAVFALTGEIGAGKTTLSKAFMRLCGIADNIVSPTYAYFYKYVLPSEQAVYHFDLYRVGSIESFFDLGFSEILYDSHNIMLFEWPAVIEPLLREPSFLSRVVWVDVAYDVQDMYKRVITVKYPIRYIVDKK